jgi:hypothetical protein
MIEKIKTEYHDYSTKNFELLEGSELGAVLRDAYKTAINLDPRLEEVEIVPLEDESNRVAFARPSWNPESGGHNQVHIRLNDLDEALTRTQNVLDNIPGARKLFGDMLDIEPQEVTPQLLHVFSIMHELGHTGQYFDHADDPSVLAEQVKKDKEALPIGRATVSALMDKNSFARKFVEDNWHKVIQVTGVSTIEELIEKQHGAYRQTKSEKAADDFARDVFATNPQLIDQLSNPNLDYYRSFDRAA